MDSIGKNIDPEKLFPRQRVLALHCRNTERALELLTKEELGRCAGLHSDGVRIFAKAIKDVALGHFPTGYRGTKRNQMRMQPFDPSGPSPHSRPPQDLRRRPTTSRWSHRQQERRPHAEAPPQRHPPGPPQQTPTYAQVVSRQQPPSSSAHELSSSDVGEIKRLLSLLCNKMLK
ncbi:hypothetical protein ABG768_020545 [Culter alburnus]|uniref:Uncharacterized protein n=1 Tax=Culter alburnus TaxID=194366 RepID=A0AAW2AZ26_CULAL